MVKIFSIESFMSVIEFLLVEVGVTNELLRLILTLLYMICVVLSTCHNLDRGKSCEQLLICIEF